MKDQSISLSVQVSLWIFSLYEESVTCTHDTLYSSLLHAALNITQMLDVSVGENRNVYSLPSQVQQKLITRGLNTYSQHQQQGLYLLPYSFDMLPACNAGQSPFLIFGSPMNCEELSKKQIPNHQLVQEYMNHIYSKWLHLVTQMLTDQFQVRETLRRDPHPPVGSWQGHVIPVCSICTTPSRRHFR